MSANDDLSPAQIDFAGDLAYASTIPGTIVCGLALVVYATVLFFPKARKYLDRVSFRLLVQALISNVLFGIAYTLTPMEDGFGCRFGAFAVNITLSLATFYTTFIAINLHLVLVYRVNGKTLEKYYVAATVLLSCGLNIPTYALGQFGYNVQSETCWYSNPDDRTRLKWIIATQSFWISLAAAIETVCSCVVLHWLYGYHKSIKALTRHAAPSAFLERRLGKDSETVWYPSACTSDILSRDPRFRSMILRIVLYPIVSLLLNFSTVALDLHMSIVGVESQLDFRLLVLDLFLYGIRPFVYGLLAFIDPSFINAFNEIRLSNSRSSHRTLTNLNFAGSESVGKSVGNQGVEQGIRLSSEFPHPLAGTLGQKETSLYVEDEEVRNIEKQL